MKTQCAFCEVGTDFYVKFTLILSSKLRIEHLHKSYTKIVQTIEKWAKI